MSDAFDLTSLKILTFLSGRGANPHIEPAGLKSGYRLADPKDLRRNPALSDVKEFAFCERVDFDVVQTVGGKPQILTSVSATILIRASFQLSAVYFLLLADGLTPQQEATIRGMFFAYVPDPAVEFDQGIIDFAKINNINAAHFWIDRQPAIMRTKVEKNDEQIGRLLSLYGSIKQPRDTSSIETHVPFPAEHMRYSDWCKENGIALQEKGRVLTVDQVNTNPGSTPVPATPGGAAAGSAADGTIDAIVGKLVDELLDQILPVQCGKMSDHRESFLRTDWMPETRVIWRPVTISLGCHEVIISVPALQYRPTYLVAYWFFSFPSATSASAIQAAWTCARRGVLAAGVMAIVLANPAAAGGAFNREVRRCQSGYIDKCFQAGVATVIETGDWVDVAW